MNAPLFTAATKNNAPKAPIARFTIPGDIVESRMTRIMNQMMKNKSMSLLVNEVEKLRLVPNPCLLNLVAIEIDKGLVRGLKLDVPSVL